MKIVKVAVRRFLGLRDLEVELSPGVNVVRGKNGSGKSSFLKAILRALTGGKGDGPWVICRGVDSEAGAAEILVELDGGFKVRRQISETGTKIEVSKKEGRVDVAARQPQKFLDSLLGAAGLNPVEFFKANAADRRKILLSAVPPLLNPQDVEDCLVDKFDEELGEVGRAGVGATIDELVASLPEKVGLAELSALEQAIMDIRSAAWIEKERAAKTCDSLREELPADYKPVAAPDTGKLLEKIREADASLAAEASAKAAFENHRNAQRIAARISEEASELVEELSKRLAAATERANEADEDHRRISIELRESEKAYESAVRAVINAAPYKKELLEIEAKRELLRTFSMAEERAVEAEEKASLVRACDKATRRGVREELPAILWSRLKGTPLGELKVAMEGDRLTVGGVDIDNLSESEQVRLSLAIARATASELKTICVDGFEALDPSTRAAFYESAKSDGFQYIVAEVSDGPLEVVS